MAVQKHNLLSWDYYLCMKLLINEHVIDYKPIFQPISSCKEYIYNLYCCILYSSNGLQLKFYVYVMNILLCTPYFLMHIAKCLYVCLYVCLYSCVSIHVPICMYVAMYVFMSVSKHLLMHNPTCVYFYVHTSMSSYMYVFIYIYMFMVCLQLCLWLCL